MEISPGLAVVVVSTAGHILLLQVKKTHDPQGRSLDAQNDAC